MSAAIGVRIRFARERRDFSQSDLARISDMDQTQVAHYENGSRAPSADNLRRLALALDVSADFLLGLSESTARLK